MIGNTVRQSFLFFVPLAQQNSLLKDDLLDPIDDLLEDEELVELVRTRLAERAPRSSRTGRHGIAPDRLLRCFVLKHLKGFSFRQLERELRANLVYRRFTRYDADPTPSYATFSRSFALFDPKSTEQVHRRVVAMARESGVARGRKLRTDTTVVETNIHYPSDSTLLSDGIRVLSQALQRLGEECSPGAVVVVDHARAVKRRVLEISRAAKLATEASRERMKKSYRKLLALTREVLRTASRTLEDLSSGKLPVVGGLVAVLAQEAKLKQFIPLVERVIAQTQARVFGGNRHVADKVLSLFEPHTVVVRKGKPHKPTEFGRLVRLDEVEHGLVSHYQVCEGNAADNQQWESVLSQHVETFGRVPRMATADRGFFSAWNEQVAEGMGVEKVALPGRGRLSKARAARQKERWFRRAMRWRAGIEARIGTLKNLFSMARATYRGEDGFERYVGGCVITHNLVSIARSLKKKIHGDKQN
jgi:IS5 family transposase